MSSNRRLGAWAVLLLLPLLGTACRGLYKTPLASVTPVGCDARKLHCLYQKVKCGTATIEEGICLFRELHERGRLDGAIERFTEDLVRYRGLAREYLGYKDYVVEMVAAELCLRGIHPRCRGIEYEEWDDIAARHDALFASIPPEERARGFGEGTIEAISRLGGATFTGDAEVEMLIDGEASWAKRREMLEGAKDRIDVLTWAFYDDPTGWEAARTFVAKAEAGIHVRIVVDGQVASRAPYKKVVDWLEAKAKSSSDAGSHRLEVIRFRDPSRPYDGQHRKVFVVDEEHLVAGGLNYGDWYSHQNPDEKERWRDTDVYVRGPAVAHAMRVFREVWNDQVKTRDLDLLLDPQPEIAPHTSTDGVRVAVVDHRPARDEHVLLSTLQAFEAAERTIDIETAYYIQLPSVDAALKRAMARGVKVRLLTNSAESVDETFLSNPVVATANALAEAGANVWLRKGSTLHSKFLVVDGVFSSIGSYNLHPRSYRLEGEVMFHILGEEPARQLTEAFEKDLLHATRITASAAGRTRPNALTALALRYFPDQL